MAVSWERRTDQPHTGPGICRLWGVEVGRRNDGWVVMEEGCLLDLLGVCVL